MGIRSGGVGNPPASKTQPMLNPGDNLVLVWVGFIFFAKGRGKGLCEIVKGPVGGPVDFSLQSTDVKELKI